MSDKYLGKTLGGRYEVREIIGTGGMAVVYKAYCTVLHRYVAIKVLKDEFASDDEFRKRFYNEAQAVAKLSHNNIVSIYDVSQGESGAEYIVMELCEGVTLKDYLRKKHHLSWQETVYFAQQVGRALAHAHSRGIIHQDIKPQNIMLLRDGTAKVMDFGIASFANSQETRKMSEAIGSVHHISPEQAKGSAVDYRTDLYSLGVVMYEMLTGTLPFRGDTAVAVVMQHINTVPPKPGELVDDVPPAMNEIVMHAMCASAAQRYSSAMELCNDLERVRNNPNLYLNYTNRAAAADFDATRAIRYDDLDEEATQLIRGVPTEPQEPVDYRSNDAGRQDRYDHYDNYNNYDEYEYEPSRKKKRGGSKVLIGGIIVVLLAVIVFAMKSAFGGGSEVQYPVPNFIGMNYEQDIQDNSEYEHFDLQVTLTEVSEDDGYEDGEVIDQDPEADTMVDEGDTVTLTVAELSSDDSEEDPEESEQTVAVPSVVGQDYDTAAAALEAAGLKAKREDEHSDSVEKGVVMAADPEEGTEVEQGSTVTLTVSEGPESEPVQVPDLSGMTQSAAETLLNQMGLTLGSVSKEESDDAPVGTVIDQSIGVGEEVEKGTAVDITIAIEPPASDTDLEPGSSGGVGFSKDGGTTYIKVGLPSDKDSVYVSVSVGGSTLYGSDTNCSRDSITIRANYSGTERVVVTVDGKTVYDDDYNFAS